MNFDYKTLRQIAIEGEPIGNWKSKRVFVSSAADLRKKGSGAYYIIYDDDNKLVAFDGNRWYSYGSVDSQGSVNEYNSRRPYALGDFEAKPKAKEEPDVEPVYVVNYDTKERATGDVKLEIDVEATLKAAREMTVDDLLAGFNYGLDAKG
jgi:hypothetical protein